jgi:hypothetical protein
MASDSSNCKLVLPFNNQPLIWVRLENLHNPEVRPSTLLALIDTGASHSIVPLRYCKKLGHQFESGTNPSATTGVGTGCIRTFAHATKITILSKTWFERAKLEDNPAFPPFELQIDFIEQNLPFALFGQDDFLKLFAYSQNGKKNRFMLKPI